MPEQEGRPTPGRVNGKRPHHEAVNGPPIGESSIDDLLNNIKQRVLRNETLNHFKKEVVAIVQLIEKQDPKLERLTDQIGAKIASILQKPEKEMQEMLRRTFYFQKRNEKKTEIGKTRDMIKICIEKRLSESNIQANGSPCPASSLLPNYVLSLTPADRELIQNFMKDLEDFVQISNLYFKHKSNEEQARVSFYFS